jgi:hypothetical protein
MVPPLDFSCCHRSGVVNAMLVISATLASPPSFLTMRVPRSIPFISDIPK